MQKPHQACEFIEYSSFLYPFCSSTFPLSQWCFCTDHIPKTLDLKLLAASRQDPTGTKRKILHPPARLALGQISAARLFNTCVRQHRNSLEMCSAAQEYKKKKLKKINRWKRWNCYPCTISTGWEMERAREEWKKKGRKLLCMEHQWQITFPAGMGQCRFHHSQFLCREQLLEWEMPKLSLRCHQRDERDSAPSLMIEHPHLPLCWTQWWLRWKMSYYWPDEAADTGWSHPPTIKHLSCHGRL